MLKELIRQEKREVWSTRPGGAFFVDLAPLADGNLAPQTVAGALELQEAPGQPLNLCQNSKRRFWEEEPGKSKRFPNPAQHKGSVLRFLV